MRGVVAGTGGLTAATPVTLYDPVTFYNDTRERWYGRSLGTTSGAGSSDRKAAKER